MGSNSKLNNGNDPDQTTVRIERTSLGKLKAIAKHMRRTVPKTLSVIIDKAYEEIVPKAPINVSRR